MVFPLLEVDFDDDGAQMHIPLVDGTKEVIDMLKPSERDDPTEFNRLIEKNETRK